MQKYPFPVLGALLLAGIFGYLVGRNMAIHIVCSHIQTEVITDTRPKESVVIFEGVRDGKVFGSVKGDVRVWVGDAQVMPNKDGVFMAEPGPLLVNTISVLVPDGMKFVASKRGKKYYPVSASEGQNIVPGNRVYFPDSFSAEDAGYTR